MDPLCFARTAALVKLVGPLVILRAECNGAAWTAQRHDIACFIRHDDRESGRISLEQACSGHGTTTMLSFSTLVISMMLSATSLMPSTCEITITLLK